MDDNFPPFVSVIIPVYNDSVRLRICLQTLEEQTYPKEAYEVIVIDNGSDESIEPIVAEFSQAKASIEPQPGSYAARNKGLSLARGEVIAFTDSDCIPASNWVEKGVAGLLAEPNCGIVGGRVEFFFKNPTHPTAAELYDSIWYLNQKMYIEKLRFSATANLFTFRRIFEYVGYFDSTLKSGGDMEWGQRVTSFGYKLLYADDVRVAHPARYSFEQLCQKVKRVTKGIDKVSKKPYSPSFRLNKDFFISLLPPVITVIRLGRTRQIDPKEQIKVILFWFALRYVKIQEILRIP